MCQLIKIFINWLFTSRQEKSNTPTFQVPNPERKPEAALEFIRNETRLLYMEAYYSYMFTVNTPDYVLEAAAKKLKELCDECSPRLAESMLARKR